MELKNILESLIFASDKPITIKQLKALTGSAKTESIKQALDDIEAEFRSSGIQLIEVGGGYQFRTHPECASFVKKLLAGRPPRLTQAMLETLAIVAYRQPVTRPEVEDIRGVDCGGVLRILLERQLVRIMGKKEEVGRPILYGTTKQFLEFFHLMDLKELPTLREFTELSEEHAEKLGQEYGEQEELEVGGDEAAESLASAAGSTEADTEELSAELGAGALEEEEPGAAALEAEELGAAALEAEELGAAALEADASFADVSFAEPPLTAAPAAAEATAAETSAEPASADAPPSQPAPLRAVPRLVDDEDEDTDLLALDRALENVEGVIRTHRQQEQQRVQEKVATLTGTGTGTRAKDGAAVIDADADAALPQGLAEVPQGDAVAFAQDDPAEQEETPA